jgi:hypothetical protein
MQIGNRYFSRYLLGGAPIVLFAILYPITLALLSRVSKLATDGDWLDSLLRAMAKALFDDDNLSVFDRYDDVSDIPEVIAMLIAFMLVIIISFALWLRCPNCRKFFSAKPIKAFQITENITDYTHTHSCVNCGEKWSPR